MRRQCFSCLDKEYPEFQWILRTSTRFKPESVFMILGQKLISRPDSKRKRPASSVSASNSAEPKTKRKPKETSSGETELTLVLVEGTEAVNEGVYRMPSALNVFIYVAMLYHTLSLPTALPLTFHGQLQNASLPFLPFRASRQTEADLILWRLLCVESVVKGAPALMLPHLKATGITLSDLIMESLPSPPPSSHSDNELNDPGPEMELPESDLACKPSSNRSWVRIVPFCSLMIVFSKWPSGPIKPYAEVNNIAALVLRQINRAQDPEAEASSCGHLIYMVRYELLPQLPFIFDFENEFAYTASWRTHGRHVSSISVPHNSTRWRPAGEEVASRFDR
ncbi:hypothetical protein R3P38DRAFT_3361298 [Favolaschia claudopus]|uniref:Uncharacterized protein n=1 Tax=Favolaschia claudopus TaxID=2862362 RepID=A0AAW0AT37_9AGAR